jgi:quercetin dioxygenase-like cupin family protein
MSSSAEHPVPGGDAESASRDLAAPLHTIDLAAELDHLRAMEGWRRSGRSSRTLVKGSDLRLVLIALKTGVRLEDHHAPGRITIHPLAGRLLVRVAGEEVDLPTGRVLTIGPAIQHEVEAREESAFLLTIAWPA